MMVQEKEQGLVAKLEIQRVLVMATKLVLQRGQRLVALSASRWDFGLAQSLGATRGLRMEGDLAALLGLKLDCWTAEVWEIALEMRWELA
jgi:hypothetical protein